MRKDKETEHYYLEEMLHYEEDRNTQKVQALKFFLYISMLIMFPFSMINFFIFKLTYLASFEFLIGLFSIALLYLIQTTSNYAMVSKLFVAIAGIVILVILLALRTEESTLIWAGIFPIITFYLLGSQKGILAHLVFSFLLFGALFLGLHNGNYVAMPITLTNVGGALIAFGVFVYFYENNRDKALQLVFHHSISDELTGAGNRKLFSLLLQKEKALSGRTIRPLSLVMVDLDHFKTVNDRFGHMVGDQVLIAFTELITSDLRQSDQFFRWGGEEFIILLPDTAADQAYTLAEKLRTLIEHHPFAPLDKLTASFGVTEVLPGESDEETIRRLDSALYHAKEFGRNRVELV